MLGAIVILLAAGLAAGRIFSPAPHEKTVYALDTILRLTAYGPAAPAALDAAEQRLREIESKLSAYREDSQIYRLNNGQTDRVDEEVFGVLSRALDVCAQTGGRFDITVKPLVDVWNINTDAPRVPSQAEIDAALACVGYQYVRLSPGDNRVEFLKPGMGIDLGGVAKGYAGDEAARVLREHGVEHACLDLGGNVTVMGGMPQSLPERALRLFRGGNTRPFRVGIQQPGAARGSVARTVELTDGCVVTSGDYERYFEQDGVRYHHILDPRTGWPADTGVRSVTVIAGDGLLADCLSTAIFVDPALASWTEGVQVITLP